MAIVEYALLLRRAVYHVKAALIDKQRHVALAQVTVGEFQCLQRPVADAQIEGLALPHDVDHGLQRLLKRSSGVIAVTVEQVHIVQPHAL